MNKATQQATVKAIEETCVTCGGPHLYNECLATGGNTFDACAAVGRYNKGELKNEFQTTMKNKNNKLKNMMINDLKNMMSRFIQMQSPSGSGSLPSNTVANPRGNLKAISTQSGVAYEGPVIPPTSSSLPKEVEQESKVTKGKMQTTSSESTTHVQPLVVQVPILEPNVASLHFDISFTDALLHMPKFASTFKSLLTEDVFVKAGKFYFPADFVAVDYDVDPWVPLILGRPFLRTTGTLIDVYSKELTLRVNDEAITFKVRHISRYSYTIIASSSPSFVPFEGGYFILEEIEIFLRTPNELSNLDDEYYNTEGDILYLEKLLNEDPSPNLPLMKNKNLKQVNVTMTKPSIEEPPELELKDLPSPLEYAFLEGTDKLPVIISKELKDKEKAALLKTHIDPQDQEKTTFTCPYGTFSYRRMTFGLCNASGMFQRCMMAIFYDMIKETMEFFMDDFLVFGDSFSSCVSHSDKMLKRCLKFLGHVGFYRRFIQDFSKIAQPMTHLLKKETLFIFSKECIEAFNILKKKLTEALILVAPDWDLPFEIICDDNDFAVDAVLGQ
nr:uncharacterized protein [Tanacetum cinerariifolium]